MLERWVRSAQTYYERASRTVAYLLHRPELLLPVGFGGTTQPYTDAQVKRIHEYKRQLLILLHAIAL